MGGPAPDVVHHRILLSGVHMHYVTAGDPGAEPLLLVHGYPKSWFEWRRMIPGLARHYHVVAPDLRGSGDSSKPADGFDKKTMAHDLVELMDALGYAEQVHVVGRDWGAPTALAFAWHWERAKTLTYIENLVPGFGLEDSVQPLPPRGRGDPVYQNSGINHFTFHQMPDVAEMLIQGRERVYFDWFLKRLAYNVGAIDNETVDECVRCMSAPGALRATLSYSREIWQDVEDNRAQLDAHGKLRIPVLALGAQASAGAATGETIRRVAEDVESDVIPDCGHWASEEQPDWIVERLLPFLSKHG